MYDEIVDLEKQMVAIEDYAKKIHEQNQEYGKPEPDITTTKKPFWKRVGSSISRAFESAKEKTKEFGEKIKDKLGKK